MGEVRPGIPPLLYKIQPTLDEHDEPAYLVGGAVRDLLLRRPVKDLDIAVRSNAILLAFKVGDALRMPVYVLDQERDSARVVLDKESTTLDFTGFRGDDLVDDLRHRDFTINAMALPTNATEIDALIDPWGGRMDLERSLVRQTHIESLYEDPLRAIRAVRLALTLGFEIEPATKVSISHNSKRLANVSGERIRDELVKIIESDEPDRGIGLLFDLELLDSILPEISALTGLEQSPPHYEPVFDHTLRTLFWLPMVEEAAEIQLQNEESPLLEFQEMIAPFAGELIQHLERKTDGGLNGRIFLRLGALFHDVGKLLTREIDANGRIRFFGHDAAGAGVARRALSRLKFSRESVRHVSAIVQGHMRPLFLLNEPHITRRAVYRYFLALGSAGVDVALLSVADMMATYQDHRLDKDFAEQWPRLLAINQRLIETYYRSYEETIEPELFLDGNDVMNIANISPGPEVGRLLRLIGEAQAAGEIQSKEEAISLLLQKKFNSA